jgi:hypothetical protein
MQACMREEAHVSMREGAHVHELACSLAWLVLARYATGTHACIEEGKGKFRLSTLAPC